MKAILKTAALFIVMLVFFAACKKDETKVFFTGGTPPVLSAITGSDTVSYINADKKVLTVNWTNPEYTFSTGVSSLDVSYLLQIDTAGSNFTNPNMKIVSVSENLSYSFTAADLNDIMQNQLNLQPAIPHTLEMRITSNLINNSAQLVSNTVQYTAIPYIVPPKVEPPPSGELYIVGSATKGGWNNPVPVPEQKFTKIDDLRYTITLSLTGGQEFLFLPVNGDWSHKYACKKTADQPKTGGDFGYDFSSNFPGPDASGTYTIYVDFQKGKYTISQ